MGTVSGKPELMKQYSQRTSGADQDLLGYVNGTLDPAVVAYDSMVPSDDRLDYDRVRSLISGGSYATGSLIGDLQQALNRALTTDHSVYTTAQAFEFAGSAGAENLIHEIAPTYRVDERILDDLQSKDPDGHALPPDELAKIQQIAKMSNDAVLRDEANRLLLNIQFKSLTDQKQTAQNNPDLNLPKWIWVGSGAHRVMEENPARKAAEAKLADINQQLVEIKGIRDALAVNGPDGPPHYLLQYDTSGPRGHAVISTGDPYAATTKNIITQVFGMKTKVESMSGDVVRSDRVYQQAGLADPTHQTAVITWYGYTAPRELTPTGPKDVLFTAEGKQGGKALSQFQADIAGLHQGPPAHMTVIAHSYGGVVAGFAGEQPGGIHAQDLIYVGSVGTSPEGLKAMQQAGVHVYTARYPNDVAQLTTDVGSIGHALGPDVPAIPIAQTLFDLTGHHEFLTTELTDPNGHSGVTRLATGNAPNLDLKGGFDDMKHAHTQYWDDPTVMDSIGKITTGTGLPTFGPVDDGPYESELRDLPPSGQPHPVTPQPIGPPVW